MTLTISKEDSVPGIYGLGCATVGDFQYAVGGVLEAGEKNYNYNMYKLGLKRLDEPNWELMFTKVDFHALYPYILQPSGTSNFVLLGGKKSLAEDSFKSFDTSILAWKNISTFQVNRDKNIPYNSYPYAGGFVQSDINFDEYFLWGGYISSKDFSREEFEKLVWLFNTKTGIWTKLNVNNGPEQYFGTTNVYKGGFYIVGGMSAKDHKVISLETVYRFDFKNRTWSERSCSGLDISYRSHHSTVVVENLLYLIGGHNITSISDRVDILNLDTLVWTKQSLIGLRGKTQGCLTHYKNKLVYSFGFDESFDSKVQVIDVSNWTLNSSKKSIDLLYIIGCSLGGVLATIVLLFLSLLWYRRHQRIKHINELYQKQYQDQIKAYSEVKKSQLDNPEFNPPIENNLDFYIKPDCSFLTSDPTAISLPPNSTEFDLTVNSQNIRYNIEIPKEWHSSDQI